MGIPISRLMAESTDRLAGKGFKSNMSIAPVMVIHITVRDRGSYFSAISPNLPGLHVCAESIERLQESVKTAVVELLRANRNIEVTELTLRPVTGMDDFHRSRGPIKELVALAA